MSTRARFYVLLVIGAALGFAVGRVGDDWSEVAFYAVAAAVLAVSVVVGLLWVEMAHDGALRRQPPR
jgi:hypothetical protein